MPDEIKVDNELPSVDDVVAAFAERGVTSFAGDGGEEPVVVEPQVTATEVELGRPDPVPVEEPKVETPEDGGQASTLPENGGEPVVDSEKAEEKPEPTPVEQPKASSAKYLEFLDQQAGLKQSNAGLEGAKAEAEKQVESLQAEVEKLKAGAPTDPMEALTRAGFSYEDATKMVLQGWEPPKVDPVDEKLAPLQKQLGEAQALIKTLNDKIAQNEQIELQKAAEAARVSSLQSIRDIAKDAEDEFPHITGFGDAAYENVNNLMLQYYQQYQVALDIKEACAIIESKYEEMLGPAFKSERLRKKYGFSEEPKKESTSEAKPEESSRKTLTNTRSSSAPASPRLGEMSDLQAQAEVAKMLKFID